MKPPKETATIVFDMTGCAMKNIDMQSAKFMINTFAVCGGEREVRGR